MENGGVHDGSLAFKGDDEKPGNEQDIGGWLWDSWHPGYQLVRRSNRKIRRV
jgi:hypothetical protein